MANDFCQFATLDHLRESHYAGEFHRMLPLAERVANFWKETDVSHSYAWPYHPLVAWSRRIEYPFCAHALSHLSAGKVLDAGSGVTFFPFHLMENREVRVCCMDTVPNYGAKLEALGRWLECTPVEYQNGLLGERLPYDDETFEAAVCVSVLEHLPEEARAAALRELWRVVKPGGRVVLTCDVALRDGAEGLSPEEVNSLVKLVQHLGGDGIPPIFPNASKLLSTRNPGYGICPLQVYRWMVNDGWSAKLLRGFRVPLWGFEPLGCLLWSMARA